LTVAHQWCVVSGDLDKAGAIPCLGKKQCVITRIPDAKQIAVFGKWIAGSSVQWSNARQCEMLCGRLPRLGIWVPKKIGSGNSVLKTATRFLP
jgi:hypothetical protein